MHGRAQARGVRSAMRAATVHGAAEEALDMRDEGLAASEVGKEIGAHADRERARRRDDRTERNLSVAEAVLLSVVALFAGWSGYAAAKWSTESRVELARESSSRTKANRAHLRSVELRNFDASTFNAWFTAFVAGNREAMTLAERRFRPEFRVAFVAWRDTKPEKNPHSPRGPTYMPQYEQPELRTAQALDTQADRAFDEGESAGTTADDYVRTTVFLAIVLFVVGISAHVPLRVGRYVLVALGTALLAVSAVLVAGLPGPPG